MTKLQSEFISDLQNTVDAGAIQIIDPKNESPEAQRIRKYIESGASIPDLIVALWQKIMEDDSTAADQIQKARVQIQQEIPLEITPIEETPPLEEPIAPMDSALEDTKP